MKILVIRRDNIGDLVCTTPMVIALRERYPQARICMLANSYNAPVVQNHPALDCVYHYTKAKHREAGKSTLGVYWDRLKLFRALQKEHFDYAIIGGAGFLSRSLRLARSVRPRHILGFTDPAEPASLHIDMGIPYSRPTSMHEVADIFRVLEPLGISGEPPAMQVVPDEQAVSRAKEQLGAAGSSGDRRRVAVHISARKPSNRWPVENFVALIRQLQGRYDDLEFVLFWSPGDENNPHHPGDDRKAQAIIDQVGKEATLLPYPTHTLTELVAGLSLCPFTVCSDGGAMHIAAALGSRIVCFFGSTDSSRWRPWKAEHILLQPDSREVKDVEVAEAVAALESLL